LVIQGYNFDIFHTPGKANIIADALSRLRTVEDTVLALSEEYNLTKKAKRLIRAVHNQYIGHHEVDRILAKLQNQGLYWTHMRENVRTYIKNCQKCRISEFQFKQINLFHQLCLR
jgi:hypothetical protein